LAQSAAQRFTHALGALQCELLRPETKAIVGQQFLTMKQTNRAQTARIDGIALVVTDGVLERVEPARHQWIDHRYGITGFGERGRPVEMKQARGFDEHEQLLWIVYLPLNRGE
jgi:hypothetical protein